MASGGSQPAGAAQASRCTRRMGCASCARGGCQANGRRAPPGRRGALPAPPATGTWGQGCRWPAPTRDGWRISQTAADLRRASPWRG
jgi:hypothetical protein